MDKPESQLISLSVSKEALSQIPNGAKAIGVVFANPRANFLKILLEQNITRDEIKELLLQLADLWQKSDRVMLDLH